MCAKNTQKPEKKEKLEAQNPLILRCHRLMEAFAKSDDERDFYIDRLEGFLIYADLDKPQTELGTLEEELKKNTDRYCLIPKLSFYEIKKIMEGFVNEKVYDIDTKEKLLDIIQSKEARENFLEFIYDHHSEQEKWQQFYQERSRIRIIEWLRLNHFHFVFEEDLELPHPILEKLKHALFQPKAGKEILNVRKILVAKAKTYYSNEALNPRPKRGRPPKQAVKLEVERQVTTDVYTTVPPVIRPFLFTPDVNTASAFSIFSSKFESEENPMQRRIFRENETVQQKLASLRVLSSRWVDPKESESPPSPYKITKGFDDDEEDDDDDEDEDDFDLREKPKKKIAKIQKAEKPPVKKAAKVTKAKETVAKGSKTAKPKRIMPKAPEKATGTKGLKKLRPNKKS
jgi:hypothetical protein